MYTKIIGITGSSGFIGSNLKKTLSKDFKVIDINLREYKEIDSLVEVLNDLKITHFLNCIGGKSVGMSKLDPFGDFISNVTCPTFILYALGMCKNKIHFTNISSAGIYGEQNPDYIKDFTFSPYAIHKKIFDDLLKLTISENVEYLVVRPFSVYGPGLKKQLLWDAYKKFTTINNSPVFYGTGNEVRNFIYIDDLCLIVKEHISQGVKGIIDVGSNKSLTIREVLDTFVSLLGKDINYNFNNIIDKGNPRDLSKTQNKLKVPFNNYTSFHEGLKKYINWIK